MLNQSQKPPATDAVSPEQVLNDIYLALREKGYNPVMQIVGYLLTEDPTYITNYNHARAVICQLDRDELLNEIVRFYFEQKHKDDSEA
ncbi:MAG: IreB family regulatory phosphoprotein [Ruminococcaceae bacterium]|nr:IreB family regulatory phosphoprotein [Oscillospiraceae bacterium]